MEEFSDVLQSFTSKLVSTYKTHTSTTRDRLHIARLTIESLPNEIIHHIVKDAFDRWDPLQLVRYTHISPRLRDVILGSSALWASISLTLDQPTQLLKTITSRSGSLKFPVNISVSGSTNAFSTSSRCKLSTATLLARFSALFDHHRRWKELTLSVTQSPAKLIQEHFPRADLSSVRLLRIWHIRFEDDFFQRWFIPAVEDLGWHKFDMHPPSSMATYTLQVCTLQVAGDNLDMASIAAFLNAATGLRSLKLFLKVEPNNALAGVPEIRLPCLEHLNIVVLSPSGIGLAASLLRAIVCPGLKHFALSASTQVEYSTLTESMRQRYPMLASFTLVITKCHTEVDFFFDDVMRPLPNTIKELRIDTKFDARAILHASRRNDTVKAPFNPCSSYSHSNLTSLDLSDCNLQPEERFYAGLSEILKGLRVTLQLFRPSRHTTRERKNYTDGEQREKNAMLTLKRAGVLVNLTSNPGYDD